MSYDDWKTTNPDDEFLGPPPCEECRQTPAGCGCCGCMPCEEHDTKEQKRRQELEALEREQVKP